MGAQVKDSLRGKLAMSSYLLAALRAAHALARRERVALVHAHWWFPSGLVASFLPRTPFVVTSHGSDLRLARSFPGGTSLFARVASRAAAMTTVSSWLAREAEQLRPGLDVRVMPMPVLGDLFHPGTERDDDRLLFIGKLSEQKGLARLLAAMTMMRTKPRLTVVGAGRLDDSALRESARTLGLDDRIEWLPILSQADLAAQYRRAAVHVIPALDEGLAAVRAYENEKLIERSRSLGAQMFTELKALQERHPAIGDVRGGHGLFAVLELVADRKSRKPLAPWPQTPPALKALVDEAMSAGVSFATRGNLILLAPPLVIEEAELADATALLDRLLARHFPASFPVPTAEART